MQYAWLNIYLNYLEHGSDKWASNGALISLDCKSLLTKFLPFSPSDWPLFSIFVVFGSLVHFTPLPVNPWGHAPHLNLKIYSLSFKRLFLGWPYLCLYLVKFLCKYKPFSQVITFGTRKTWVRRAMIWFTIKTIANFSAWTFVASVIKPSGYISTSHTGVAHCSGCFIISF